ncbi:MAG: hypothetical protein KKH28_00430 [Elusimicrobia bacterium]|nr:hypothetical protein [Elusimicrobiota bacterium]
METAPDILVIRLSSLGDIILTAPVLRNIRNRWPAARLTMLVKPQFAAAVRKNPFVSEVLPFTGLSSTLRAIKRGRHDILLDLHANLRSRLLSVLSGIPVKARYRKDSLARRLFVNFRVPSPALEKHTLERYLQVLEKIGVPVVFREPLMGDWTTGPGPAVSAQGRKRICLLQTAFLGDSVLTLPLLEKIKKAAPDSDITVVARPDTAAIFASCGLAAEIMTDNKREAGSFWAGFRRLAGELKKRKFDIAIVPHRSLRSALLVRFAGIPVRIGFDSSAGSFLFTHKIPFSWLIHDLERNLTLLLPLAPGLSQTRFPPLRESSAGLTESGAGAGIFIGANPGSVWPTKRWPSPYWARLIKKLSAAYGTRVLLVGGKNEAAWNAEIEAAAGPETCLNLTGKTGIDELMAAIKRLKVFITNDSGPMHIAVAFGVPVAAVFGPTTKELGFFPYGERNTVLEADLACRPCALHGSVSCPRGHFLCMRLITPDKVFDAAKEILGRSMAIGPDTTLP